MKTMVRKDLDLRFLEEVTFGSWKVTATGLKFEDPPSFRGTGSSGFIVRYLCPFETRKLRKNNINFEKQCDNYAIRVIYNNLI